MSVWIFGYGSLVWRPAFPYAERHGGAVTGWVRRFWQGSTDHRGVPGAPGRVVTLAPSPGARCWGVAYRVAASDSGDVLAALDHREKGGYARHEVRVHFAAAAREVDALVYVATRDNPNYLGPAPSGQIAEQIVASRGPSGSNIEYVLRLAAALRELGADDDHVYELERLVIRAAASPGGGGDAPRPRG